MTLNQLRYFCTASRCHSITKAAEELYVTQPTVSTAIRDLEIEFGISLFYRKGNQLILTGEGETLYEKANYILQYCTELQSDCFGLSRNKPPIRIGIPPMLSTVFFPELLTAFQKEFENYRISLLLSGEFDGYDAVMTLHAGAGGTESCDWTSMLYRMYTRWAEKHGFKVEVLDYLEGDEAGIKSVTIQISGQNAYGYLKSEKGVHRLVRISPFNAAGKRQTSFASCDVIPEIEEDLEVDINEDDLRIDTYRSSGAGGQHINKTSSAVRITHIPTGIVVQCQNERSQHMNKDKAMQMLKSKLYLIKKQENLDKISDIRGEILENGFGSQIRSYVMQPYTMVKDHRTGEESGNVAAVLDGELDGFMNAYLKWCSRSE